MRSRAGTKKSSVTTARPMKSMRMLGMSMDNAGFDLRNGVGCPSSTLQILSSCAFCSEEICWRRVSDGKMRVF